MVRFACCTSSAACKSLSCRDNPWEVLLRLWESRERIPVPGELMLESTVERFCEKPVVVFCNRFWTAEKLLERVEASLPLSTERVPSLLKLTPMLARFTIPLFPLME